LSDAAVVPLQQSIGRLLENELQRLMLARGNKEFSYRFVDRAAAPKWRASPKRVQVVLVAAVVGAMVALLFVFVRHSVQRYRMQREMSPIKIPS
jgi:uncharacterized protein involved in exopolysaccharide biosynthesis